MKKLGLILSSFVLATSVVSLSVSAFMPSSVAKAQLGCDETFMSLNTNGFYGPCDAVCDSTSTSSGIVKNNTDYAGNRIFNQEWIKAIEENKPFYEKAAAANGIPWQMIAAIHLRETNLSRSGPANGQGPYQITSTDHATGEYTDEQFQEATNSAAAFIKAKAGGKNLQTPDNVKYTFFAYNGAAKPYIDQALALDFSEEEAANGEGSPYVMNRYDAKRDPTIEPVKSDESWGQIKSDGGSIEYPANSSHHGAFVYYNALTTGGDCSPSSKGNQDANTILRNFNDYINANGGQVNEQGHNYRLGYNGCTSLTLWYVANYTSLTYGIGNGEGVVRNMVSANKDKNLKVSSTPVPMAIFSVAGGTKSWGASGIPEGHTGLVVSIDEAKQEATVIDTWSGRAGQSDKAQVRTFKYPASGVSFVHIGEYLK